MRAPSPEIPGYSIISELGSGGMATVYLAIQENFGRKVALKVMSPALAADNTYGERFMREARIAARFSHPNIIAVYDVGVHGNHYYIAMEYHAGGDLKSRIKKRMTPRMAMVILRQMAAALDYAHTKGYIHRDVKPDNILFRDDGSAVLTDFGIARPAAGGNTQMTQAGMVVGTPKYMSPEQARGKELDARSDIYSLGIVFYEMLTGKVPFEGEDSIAIGIQHVKEPVPPLPDKLKALQPIIDRLLAKQADSRYSRGKELAADLDRLRLGVLKNTNSGTRNEAVSTTGTLRATPADRAIEQRASRTAEDPTVEVPETQRKRAWLYTSAGLLAVIAGAWYADQLGSFDPIKQQLTTDPEVQQAARDVQVWLDTQGLGIKLPQSLLHGPDWQEPAIAVDPGPAVAEPEITEVAAAPTLEPSLQEAWITVQGGKQLGSAVNSQWHPGRVSQDGAAASAANALAVDMAQVGAVDTLAEKISELIEQAESALAANRLSQPPGNNALETYRSVLLLQPENPEALAGLDKVANAYVALSDKAITDGLLGQSHKLLGLAESIQPQLAGLGPARERLAAARKAEQERIARAEAEANRADNMLNQFKITGLIRGAEYDIGQGKLTSPQGDNALEKYREALSLNPGNQKAREGIINLAERIGQQLKEAIEAANTAQATALLDQLKLVIPKHPRIQEAEAAVAALSEQAVPIKEEAPATAPEASAPSLP